MSQARFSYGDADLEQFALRVVAQIASAPSNEDGKVDGELHRLIVRHARNGSSLVLEAAYSRMKTLRIGAERVVDVYLPAAARDLGDSWHDGETDILHTTIALARLQALLREIGRAWAADHASAVHGARVVLAVPQDEQHTLGPLIAAHQLRRLGVSVNVQFMLTPVKLAAILNDNMYDAVFISVANHSNLAICRHLVKTARQNAQVPVPVVVGGPLNDLIEGLRAETGADVATNDVGRALEECGLSAYHRAVH